MRRLLYNKQGKVVCLVSGSTLDKRGCPHSPRSWSPVAREAECIASAQGSTGGGGGTRGRGSPNHGQRARAHSPPIQQPSCRAVVLPEDTGDVRDGVDGHGWGGGAGVIRNKAKQIWVQMQSGPSAMHRRADGRDTSAHMEQTVYVLKLLPLKTLTPLS